MRLGMNCLRAEINKSLRISLDLRIATNEFVIFNTFSEGVCRNTRRKSIFSGVEAAVAGNTKGTMQLMWCCHERVDWGFMVSAVATAKFKPSGKRTLLRRGGKSCEVDSAEQGNAFQSTANGRIKETDRQKPRPWKPW
jgi:hypothetical protein